MKRKLGLVVVVGAALAAALLWRCHAGASHTAGTRASSRDSATPIASAAHERVDPRKAQRASIAGTVTDDDHASVANARVCVRTYSPALSTALVREARCTVTDAQGRYTLPDLFAANYAAAASAKSYRPGTYRPPGERRNVVFHLAAGEHKTGVDIVLRKGGVEITGTVSDVTGGPVAHAQVTAEQGWWGGEFVPVVESDDAGKFSLWVSPGDLELEASAEGYAPGSDYGKAPGSFEILLTPESSLSGTVVDAKSGQPVAGVSVSVSEHESGFFFGDGDIRDITDDQGKFHVDRIQPGRFLAVARSAGGYGRSEGTTLVGLGQHVDGVIVKLHPGFQVSGKIVLPDKSTCKQGRVELTDSHADRSASTIDEPDGSVHADGVLPGDYSVDVSCDGYLVHDHYANVVVKDKDVAGLRWEVDAGATIRGRVVTKSGAPVDEARVSARNVGGAAREKVGRAGDRTTADGHFVITGVRAGTVKLDVGHDLYNAPKDGWKVEVTPGAVIERELVVEDGGSIKGVVVDAQGKPVAAVHVSAMSLLERFWGDSVRTNSDGGFQLDGLRPGEYRITAHRGFWDDNLKKPGSTDDDKQGERATVTAGKPASVKLVVESQSGVIKGVVTDPSGKPVSDAFVSVARESDAAGARGSSVSSTRWSWDEKPVVSSVDGKFSVAKLSPGKYTLRAYRKGGGEAIAEHVAVGGTAKLQIRATGSISGVVHGGSGKLDDLSITLADEKNGFSRNETFFRTDGRFAIRDLPQGSFTLTAQTAGGKKQVAVELGEGQTKTVDVTLDELVTIAGRVVELGTNKPVAGMRMMASLGKRGGSFVFRPNADEETNTSDTDGRFTIENAPRGSVTITAMPKDWSDGDYGFLSTVRDVAGTGTVDIGDVSVIKKRVKRGDPVGDLGVKFADQPPGIDFDKQTLKVSYIDPKGPAAKTELQVGDIVTSVDGIDCTGANYGNGWTLMRAPPATPLKLGLARGTTVTIVLAAPS